MSTKSGAKAVGVRFWAADPPPIVSVKLKQRGAADSAVSYERQLESAGQEISEMEAVLQRQRREVKVASDARLAVAVAMALIP